MAYSLIAWHYTNPEENDVLGAIEGAFDDFTTPLAPRLRLDTDNDWGTLMERIWYLVRQYPGMQAMIIVSSRGSPVGGWVASAPPTVIETASSVMNNNGNVNGQYPMMFPLPTQMNNVPNDWHEGIQWPRGGGE